MNYTPSPWKWMYWKCDGEIVYNVKPVMRPGDGQIENKADAVLFAAAPDLLEALLVVLDQVDYTNGACSFTEMVGAVLSKDVIKKARAAIAKAVSDE